MSNFTAPDRPLSIQLHHWASLHSELLWTYDGVVGDDANTTVDHRIGYWAWLIRRGSASISTANETLHAEAGKWIISPHAIITQTFAPNTKILSVHFRCQWPSGENLFGSNQGIAVDAQDYPKLERVGSTLQRLVHRHFPKTHRQHLSVQASNYKVFWRFQMAFTQWLIDFSDVMVNEGRVLAHAGESDPRIQRAMQCLNESPLHEPFPTKHLQNITGLGRARLDHLFFNELALTTRQYWNKLRTQYVTRNLEESPMSIKEISYQVGFKQPSHFTNWFFLQTGSTPRDFRRIATQNRKAGII